jgi:hypothetical protein
MINFKLKFVLLKVLIQSGKKITLPGWMGSTRVVLSYMWRKCQFRKQSWLSNFSTIIISSKLASKRL